MTTDTLMMVPGLGSDEAVWRRTIASLDGKVNCVVGNTRIDGSLQAMAQRILDAAPPSFALAGVSMGGMVALEMIRIAPQRITRLALVDTNARPDTVARKTVRHLSNWIVAHTGRFERLSASSVRSLVHPAASSDIRAELVAMATRVGPEVYVRQNRALIARGDLRSVVKGIAVPTVVVVGAEDQLTPVKLSEEIHALVPASTLRIIHGCGHLPPIEKPELMAGILLDLIK